MNFFFFFTSFQLKNRLQKFQKLIFNNETEQNEKSNIKSKHKQGKVSKFRLVRVILQAKEVRKEKGNNGQRTHASLNLFE